MIIKFNIHRSVEKKGSLITRKSLKLVDNISNQLNHQYYQDFWLIM